MKNINKKINIYILILLNITTNTYTALKKQTTQENNQKILKILRLKRDLLKCSLEDFRLKLDYNKNLFSLGLKWIDYTFHSEIQNKKKDIDCFLHYEKDEIKISFEYELPYEEKIKENFHSIANRYASNLINLKNFIDILNTHINKKINNNENLIKKINQEIKIKKNNLMFFEVLESKKRSLSLDAINEKDNDEDIATSTGTAEF